MENEPNPEQFDRYMQIQSELKEMGFFCISMYSKGDISELFNDCFSEDYEELTEDELTRISERMEESLGKNGSISNDKIFDLIQEELNKR